VVSKGGWYNGCTRFHPADLWAINSKDHCSGEKPRHQWAECNVCGTSFHMCHTVSCFRRLKACWHTQYNLSFISTRLSHCLPCCFTGTMSMTPVLSDRSMDGLYINPIRSVPLHVDIAAAMSLDPVSCLSHRRRWIIIWSLSMSHLTRWWPR